jgi:hypothetical protein
VPHVFSHLRLLTRVHLGDVRGDPAPRSYYTDVRWVPAQQVDGMALSTLARKTLRAGVGAAALSGVSAP